MIRTVLAVVFSAALLAGCSTAPPPTPNPGNSATAIDSFGATPNPSPINVGVSFSWTVTGSNLTCTLDAEGDGKVDYTVQNCTSQSRVVHNYGAQGAFTARLAVSGADGQSKTQVTPVTVGAANLPPTIPTLQPQLVTSGDPLEVTFVWSVDDRNADITRCQFDADSDGVLEYDNLCSGLPTTSVVKPSATVSHIFKYKYPKRGRYTATLRASDPYSSTTASVRLRAPLNTLPAIDTFTATAGPNNTASLAFRVSDADDDPLSCKLTVESIGSFNYPTCRNLTRTFTFKNPGKYRATLEVSDSLQTASKGVNIELGEGPPPPLPVKFVQVVGGQWHTCGITSTGDAYCWGRGLEGQLGNGIDGSNCTPGPNCYVVPNTNPPLKWYYEASLQRIEGYTFTQLAAGETHTCGLTSAGAAYCWGSHDDGQLGIGSSGAQTFPRLVSMPTGVTFKQLGAGTSHTCGLSAAGSTGGEGQVYCWGKNNARQLGQGDGDTTNRNTPQLVSGFTFTQLSVGTYNTCGLDNAGAAYCWGANDYGTVGNGSITVAGVPKAVSMPTGVTFKQLAIGSEFVCALSAAGSTGGEGQVYCWGNGYLGTLGNGKDFTNCSSGPQCDSSDEKYFVTSPAAVSMPAGVTFQRLAGQLTDSICALSAAGSTGGEGQVYCWGRGDNGELGNGTDDNNCTPGPNCGDYYWENTPNLATMPTGITFTQLQRFP